MRDERAEFGRPPQPRGDGDGGGEAHARRLGEPREQGRIEGPRAEGIDPHADLREIARRRQRHSDHAALRRAVGDLADLPVEGGDGRGAHDDAPLTVFEGLGLRHRRSPEPQHVEGADEVHGERLLEGLERVRLALSVEDPPRDADAGAAHGDAHGAHRRGEREGRRDVRAARDVRLAEGDAVPELARERAPSLFVQVDDHGLRAAGDERPHRRLTEP
jgi:hypothetical protein